MFTTLALGLLSRLCAACAHDTVERGAAALSGYWPMALAFAVRWFARES